MKVHKRDYTLLVAMLLLLAACSGRSSRSLSTAPAPTEPTYYTYRVKATYPHATDAYTQGLHYEQGALWEGTGEYGHSEVRHIDLSTGRHRTTIRLPKEEFGEGIAILGDSLYQLTWESNTCHLYNKTTGKKIGDFRYAGEGWGLTTDGKKLYMSNGTANLYTLDAKSFRRESSRTVTLRGQAVQYLNELEWIEGRIWANVYTTDQIVMINPRNGIVEGVLDLTGLLPEGERTPATDVLNGIAYDPVQKRIFVTGKRWPKIYEIEVIKR